MELSPATMKRIRAGLEQHLKTFGEAHGLVVEAEKIYYDEHGFRVKVLAHIQGGLTPTQVYYNEFQARNGLPPLDSVVKMNREDFIVRGMKPRGVKCILVERVRDQHMLVCDVDTLLRAAAKGLQKLTLTDFTREVNKLYAESMKGTIFAEKEDTYSESMMAHYHQDGYTPRAVLEEIQREAAQEANWEARVS